MRDILARNTVLSVVVASLAFLSAPVSGADISAYASFDISSAYVLYCARQNKEPCFWTYGALDFCGDRLGTLELSLWQNTDMTCRRKETMGRMNEWDWRAAYLNTLEIADGWRINAEIGHIWYKYHGLRGKEASKAYATMMEVYGRLSCENPYLTPYVFAAYDHRVTEGTFALLGVKRSFEMSPRWSFTPELSIGGGDGRYLACLYPPWGGEDVGTSISCSQLSGRLDFKITKSISFYAAMAFSVIVDDEIRQAISRDGSDYANQFVWGNIGVSICY